MNKKVFFTLACAALLALGFVCQKQSSVNALVDNNIEALTSGDGGNVSLESVNALTTGYTKFYAGHNPFTGEEEWIERWMPMQEGFRQGGSIGNNMYLCTWSEGNKLQGYCYEIVVRP